MSKTDDTKDEPDENFDPIRIAKEGAQSLGERVLFIDLRRAVTIGLTAAVFIFLSTFGMGHIGDLKALGLLKAILPTTRFMSSAILGAGATILALMLTLLSFGAGDDKQFGAQHFERVRQIALLCTILIVASVLLLLLLNVPLEEGEAFQTWYEILYYFVVTYSALLGGALIATVFMLYKAVTTLIAVVNPHEPTPDKYIVSSASEETEK